MALPVSFQSLRCLVPHEMATTNPPFSEVVFSGYRPIEVEVTANEFLKTIGDGGSIKARKRKTAPITKA